MSPVFTTLMLGLIICIAFAREAQAVREVQTVQSLKLRRGLPKPSRRCSGFFRFYPLVYERVCVASHRGKTVFPTVYRSEPRGQLFPRPLTTRSRDSRSREDVAAALERYARFIAARWSPVHGIS